MSTDSNKVDAEFLAWTKANACGHEIMAKALADTERLCRRPRRLLAEYRGAWIRAIVRASKKRWWGIPRARDYLGVSERTIWRVLAPAPAAPALTNERFLKTLADNLEIAERSGNRRAAEFLRRQLRRFETARPDLTDTATF
jgi:hypothetical protein